MEGIGSGFALALAIALSSLATGLEATCTTVTVQGERGKAGYGCIGAYHLQSMAAGWPVYRMDNHDGTCGNGEYGYMYHFKGHWLISSSLYKMPFILVSAPMKSLRNPEQVGSNWLSARKAWHKGLSKYQRAQHIQLFCTKRKDRTVATTANPEACKAVELLGLLPETAAAAASCNGRYFLERALSARFRESGGRPVYRMYAPGARCGGRETSNAYIFFSVAHQMWIVSPRAYGPPFLLAKKSNALTPEAAQGHWMVEDKTDGVFRRKVYPTVKCERAHERCPCGFAPFGNVKLPNCCKGKCPVGREWTDYTQVRCAECAHTVLLGLSYIVYI
jgi:hypothetical protein